MKRLGILFIMAILVCCCSCSSSEDASDGTSITETTNNSDTVELSERDDADNKILIAYFTWADNTTVENPEEVDVDAQTSASVLPPGNTEIVAGFIHDYVGGDMFSIITEDGYSSNYDECLDKAAEEKAENARPALKNHVENMDEYDVIFLGYPNWWYTCPMAIFSFLEEYDFTGKTIVPFCAHGTGGLADSIDDIRSAVPGVEVSEPFDVYRPDTKTSQDDVIAWLNQLGFEQNSQDNEAEDMTQVKMTVDNEEIIIDMYDNETARDFVAMLPMELNFEDFNGTEKISYLNEQLAVSEDPEGFEPLEGDFTLYIPWGNIAIFYNNFIYSEDLVPLGHINSGLDILKNIEGDFSAIIEIYNQ